jgi:serine/threonine protein kinase
MVGQTISHFRVFGKLGEGGMGVVYVGQDTKLHRTVALNHSFIAMEFIEGHTVKEKIDARPLPLAEAAGIAIQCRASFNR